MHILVTNDDGINSPGLWVLAGALHAAGYGEVTIVAPEQEQSGMGMSLPPGIEHSLRPIAPPDPSYAQITAFALSGTPVGCVSVGMLAGICPPVDVVVSGINRGINSGTNIFLSGTVGAALIATLWGVSAMAVSLQYIGNAPMPWETAAWAATRLFPLFATIRDAGPIALNVNVPHTHAIADLRGFRQTHISDFFFGHYVNVLTEPSDEADRQRVRFKFMRDRIPTFPETSDDGAIRAGYVSVTPISPRVQRHDVSLSAALEQITQG